MANELDELTGPVNGAGRDINVIEKQLPARVGWGSTLFEIVLWCLFIVPGLIFLFMKIGAKNYFQQLQQKIQADASTIDNYLEQRVQILKNLAKLVEKAIDLDKDVMKAVAAFRQTDRRAVAWAVNFFVALGKAGNRDVEAERIQNFFNCIYLSDTSID